MKQKEIKKIISDYKPHVGFFDLSIKPQTLSREEYAKILQTQNFLAAENNKFSDEKIREDNKIEWNQLKILSGKLQAMILQHWPIDDLQ